MLKTDVDAFNSFTRTCPLLDFDNERFQMGRSRKPTGDRAGKSYVYTSTCQMPESRGCIWMFQMTVGGVRVAVCLYIVFLYVAALDENLRLTVTVQSKAAFPMQLSSLTTFK